MAIADLAMADLVREVCHDTGAGALVLGGPVLGYRVFGEAVETGARFPYVIVGIDHPDEWECGTGALDGSGRLVRTPAASSAHGAAVDFSAGEKRVALTPGADWLMAVDGHGHGLGEIDGLALALAGKQAASDELSAIAALTTTGFGRAAMTLDDAAAFRAYIGAGTSSTTGTVTSVGLSGGSTGLSVSGGPVTGSGTMVLGGTLGLANGGTGATSAGAARSALGLAIGTDVQAQSANLSALAGLTMAANRFAYFTGASAASAGTITAFGRSLIDDADAPAARATMGLGSMAEQAAGAVAITGGSIAGITDLAIADGGTGASTASAARNNLGLGTASTQNTGTSGATVPLLNGAGTWSAAQLFTAPRNDFYAAGGTSTILGLSADAGFASQLRFSRGGVASANLRWIVQMTSALETGANAGSNFTITNFDDAAGTIGTAVTINRASGVTTLTGLITASATISGGSIAGISSLNVSHPSSTTFSHIDSLAGQFALIRWRTGTSARWDMGKNMTAESGGNAGSDWVMRRFDDMGTTLGTAISIVRATGETSIGGNVLPTTDNSRTLGTASFRWSTIYAATGTINTSDERRKQEVSALAEDETLLEAWADVAWVKFRFRDAVATKGAGARWHFGLIAQQVRDAIDAKMGAGAAVRLGLVCHDQWEAVPEARDADGLLIREARMAGDRWGLRYEECFALEAAWQRRRIDRIETMIAGGGVAAG